METHECLDVVLNEYKHQFTAKDLAKAAQVPESTISAFRRGEKNPGVKIFDRIRQGLQICSPSAYLRFMSLLTTTELDIVQLVATAPLHVQSEILACMASNSVFSDATLSAAVAASSTQSATSLLQVDETYSIS